MKHIKRIKIDIDKKNFKVIPSVQFDNARFLHINLVNGSMLFDLTGCSVKISGTKPDGTIIFNNCTIINEKEGFIEVELTEQINAVPGIVKCELKLYDGNGVLTTKNFDIEVSASATANGITSSNEFKALTDALKVVQGIDNKADKEKVEEKFGEVYEQLDNIVPEERLEKIENAKLNYIVNFETFEVNKNVNDDTQMLQNLITKAIVNNDNRVKLPSRTIYLTDTISIPRGVTIEGNFGSTGSGYGTDTSSAYAQINSVNKQSGTVIVWGGDIDKNIFVLEGAGACIRNLSILYANQVKYLKPNVFNINNVKKYAPSIRSQKGNNHRVENIIFLNAYEGILATGKTTGLVIKDIWTQTFASTIILDDVTEFYINNVNYRCGGHYFGNRNTTIQPEDSAVIKMTNRAGLGFINNLAVNRHNCALMCNTDWGVTLHNAWIDEVKYPLIITQSSSPTSTGKFRVFLSNIEIGEGCLYARNEYTNLTEGTTSNYFNELNPNPIKIECTRGDLTNTRYEYFVEMVNCLSWCPISIEGTMDVQISNSYLYQGLKLKANNLINLNPILKVLLSNCIIDNQTIEAHGNCQIYQSNCVARNSANTVVNLVNGTLFNEVKSLDSNDIIYYDRGISSNIQDGTINYPYTTLGKVKTFLPKRVDGNITIYVNSNTTETIDLSNIDGNGTITIRGNGGEKTVGHIILNGIKCNVILRDLKPLVLNDNKLIRIFNCTNITLKSVSSNVESTTAYYIENSNVTINGGNISNSGCVIDSTSLSKVLITSLGGSSNNVGYRARKGGTIYIDNSTLSATTLQDEQKTGTIIS